MSDASLFRTIHIGGYMRKYFFFDIDGTLTTPLTADYPKSAQETIRKLKEQGHLVAIATGRMQADAAEVAEKLGIDTIVSDGGNAVTENGKIYFHKSLPINSSFSLLDDLDVEKHPWAVAPMNKKYRKTRCINYLQKVVDRYYETEVDPNYDYHSEDTLYKIFISCKKDEVNDISLHGLPYVWFSTDTMIIESTSKERGIEYLQQKYNASDDQIIVFGDGLNDRSMFKPEWMSIAMGNGKDELKKKAKYVTDNAENDGIYKACKHFGWI